MSYTRHLTTRNLHSLSQKYLALITQDISPWWRGTTDTCKSVAMWSFFRIQKEKYTQTHTTATNPKGLNWFLHLLLRRWNFRSLSRTTAMEEDLRLHRDLQSPPVLSDPELTRSGSASSSSAITADKEFSRNCTDSSFPVIESPSLSPSSIFGIPYYMSDFPISPSFLFCFLQIAEFRCWFRSVFVSGSFRAWIWRLWAILSFS